MTTSDARKRIAEKSAPAQDTDHPSLAKYRQWHEEARQEAADLRAENERLRRLEVGSLGRDRAFVKEVQRADAAVAERDRLAGVVERVKALADRRVYIYKDDLIAAIEGDGGGSDG